MQRQLLATPASKTTLAAAIAIGALTASALAVHLLARRAEREHRALGRLLQVDGATVHCVERGSGRPVVVLHGNGAMVEEQEASLLIDRLALAHHVVAIDRPGFGLSPRTGRAWTPETEAQLVVSLIRKLGLERPVIVAHSWSALVALSVALKEPDAISGLVLIGGFYYPGWRMDVLIQSIVSAPLVGDLLRHTFWPLVARAAAPFAFKKIFSPMPPSARFLRGYSVPIATRPSQLTALADDTVEMPRAAARLCGRYREILLPVDLIAGTRDKVVSAAGQSRRLHRELHNSFLDEVPGAGHMVHHAYPELVAQRVGHVFERALKPVGQAGSEAHAGVRG